MTRRVPPGRDLAWFVLLPLALGGGALLVQHAIREHRLANLWTSPAPPPPAPR